MPYSIRRPLWVSTARASRPEQCLTVTQLFPVICINGYMFVTITICSVLRHIASVSIDSSCSSHLYMACGWASTARAYSCGLAFGVLLCNGHIFLPIAICSLLLVTTYKQHFWKYLLVVCIRNDIWYRQRFFWQYVVVICGQTAGWIKMPLSTEVGLGPCDIVLPWGPSKVRCTALPTFRPMSVVAKRSPISAT